MKIGVKTLKNLMPERDLVEAALRLMRSRQAGRPIKMARLLQEAGAAGGLVGKARTSLLCLQVLSRTRADYPTGIKGELKRMVARAAVDADHARAGKGDTHIGYEYMVEDAVMRGQWDEALRLCDEAQRAGWGGDWEGFRKMTLEKKKRGRRKSC